MGHERHLLGAHKRRMETISILVRMVDVFFGSLRVILERSWFSYDRTRLVLDTAPHWNHMFEGCRLEVRTTLRWAENTVLTSACSKQCLFRRGKRLRGKFSFGASSVSKNMYRKKKHKCHWLVSPTKSRNHAEVWKTHQYNTSKLTCSSECVGCEEFWK